MRTLFIIIFLLSLVITSLSLAQIISNDSVYTPINISDNNSLADSTIIDSPKRIIPFNISVQQHDNFLSTFRVSKTEIDFENYRSIPDLLYLLPFGSLNNFGSFNAPVDLLFLNLPSNIFSVSQNNFSHSNKWHGASELNLLQTENISELEITPISRSFLFNSQSNFSILNIVSNDSIAPHPISRIRFYQAPNNDASIDAMFSARILNNTGLMFRLTNSSNDGAFSNSQSGVWKADLKTIYKFSDSLFASIEFIHSKSNMELNGGIDFETLSLSQTILQDGFYNVNAPVMFENRHKENSTNQLSTQFNGHLAKSIFSKVVFNYTSFEDRFRQNMDNSLSDSSRISNFNSYSLYSASVENKFVFNKLVLSLFGYYDQTDYDVDYLNLITTEHSYFISGVAEYDLFDSLIVPAVFVKLGSYEKQSHDGFGFDVKIKLNNNFKLMSGFSSFIKPYLMVELQSQWPYFNTIEKRITNFFTTLEANFNRFKTSATYYNINLENTHAPVFNNQMLHVNSTIVTFPLTEQIKTEGINFISRINFWKIETFLNYNYVLNESKTITPQNSANSLTAGLYYVDVLYNDNLNLKTGFTIYLQGNIDHQIYDFQSMRSSSYYYSNNANQKFNSYLIDNNPFRLDYTLAGKIQNRATFYFAYENILGNNYYIVPYYPMPEGGIKIGVSWDFLD